MLRMMPARTYVQRGADHSLEHPGLGFAGWKDIEIPVDPEHTAIIVMHAWDSGTQETQPVSWDMVEYIERANQIVQERFPGFLEKVRASGIRLIHIGAGFEKGFEDLPGYRRVASECPPETVERLAVEDEAGKALWQLRLGKDDDQLVKELFDRDFIIKAQDHEDVVKTSGQLFHLCKKYGISHLIYTGFAVNACLVSSAGGYIDMVRHGVICSIVSDLTTAVENKETCVEQRNKEDGLWKFAIGAGFVLDQKNVEEDLLTK